MTINFSRIAQITNSNIMQITALKQNKASTKVVIKHSNFVDVFFKTESFVTIGANQPQLTCYRARKW